MNNRTLGAEKENLVCQYLMDKDYSILEKNYSVRFGEIDIIAKTGEYIVFIEVKYRKTNNKGQALYAVPLAKQKKICKVADYYRMCNNMGDFTPIRYDVVALEGEEIIHIENAFEHIYCHG